MAPLLRNRCATGPRFRRLLAGLALAGIACAAVAAVAAAPSRAPADTAEPEAGFRQLKEATDAVVMVRTRALGNARSKESLGAERTGTGVVIAPSGLVLTIGYLVLEAERVDLVDANGRAIPGAVVAYDHATGFGLVRPLAPLAAKPIRLGDSGALVQLDRLLVASGGLEGSVSVATVVSRRTFAGYWEYLIDGAIYTSPPRLDHSGAALINREGELVGIGSLLVMDAMTPGERLPGNLFVPIDLLKPVLAEMIETGRQKAGRRPWIGVNTVEDGGRVRVVRVTSEGPAERAGLKPGDLILSVAGTAVGTLPEFYGRLWAAGAPGEEVRLTVLQGTQVREIAVQSMDRLDFLRRKPTI